LIDPQNGFEKAMPLKMMNNQLMGHRCGQVSPGWPKRRKIQEKCPHREARFPEEGAQGISVAGWRSLRPTLRNFPHE
jgi:hypothetical protein